MPTLRDRLVTARAVYGRRRHELAERRVRPNRRTPPPLDYPYREAGSGPPLVLVHGMVDQQEAWRFGVGAWAERFRVISFDLPGCNRMPRRGEASVEGYADFLHEFTSSLGLERFFLLGLSFGSRIVLEYAVRHPPRVRGLVLASPSLRRPDEAARRRAAFVARHKGRRWAQALVGALKTSRPYLYFLASSVTHCSRDHFAFNVSLLAEGQRASDPLTWLDNYQSLLTSDLRDRLDALARTDVPYLAVFGESDGLVSLGRLPEVGALAGRVRTLPGTYHCVHIEESAAFNAAVAEFFEGCPP